MAEDRLDQKLTLTCNDGRSIDGDLNLGGLPDWPALTTFVISITLILFLAQWSFRFGEVDSAVEYKGLSEASCAVPMESLANAMEYLHHSL